MLNRNLKVEKILIQDIIFEELKSMILKGELKVGDKLPSEKELSDIFGVNRLTVRLAIQKLNTLGITETKVGKGTYIIDFDINNYMSQISSIIGNRSLDDVLEFRKLIEIDSAILAIERATENEIKKVEEIFNAYKKMGMKLVNMNKDEYDRELFNQYVLKDYEIHESIVKMSHNNVYISAYGMVKEPVMNYIRNILEDRVIKKRSIRIVSNDIHEECIEAIKIKNKEMLKENYIKCIDYKIEV